MVESGVVVVVGFELVVGDDDVDDEFRGVQMIRPELGSVVGCHDDDEGVDGRCGVDDRSGFLRMDLISGTFLGFLIMDLDLSSSCSWTGKTGSVILSSVSVSSVSSGTG